MHERLTAMAERLAAAGERPAPPCPDPVNAAMIRTWLHAMGHDAGPRHLKGGVEGDVEGDLDGDPDGDPGRYLAGGLAPPAMIQVWSMQPGGGVPRMGRVADEPLRLLDEAGFTGVVATNCEQTYDRYLRHGERLTSTLRFGGIAGPKRTGLGEGYFVTWRQFWYDQDGGRVAEMLFRVLKFRPRERRPGPEPARYPPRPAVGPDGRFFWAGAREGELRIQRCADCGALRHPPGPMCPACHSVKREYVVAGGAGTVHSYVVHHHPPVPGRTAPYVVALIELAEGVRMVGNVLGCPPDKVRVGMPVRVAFERVDDELTLPQWTPADAPPALEIALTPTFVISAALATRDFNPVHHDAAVARAQGATDIFLNILTTMGLVQRYVDGLLPGAGLRGIAVRLGIPAYAGDTLTLTGRRIDDTTVRVRGAVSLGEHVTATVRLTGEPPR